MTINETEALEKRDSDVTDATSDSDATEASTTESNAGKPDEVSAETSTDGV
jgi:hypothetical protein